MTNHLQLFSDNTILLYNTIDLLLSQKCMHPVHGAAFWGVKRALQSDINLFYPPPPPDLPGRAGDALGIYLYGGKERDS
jgi:hypothetical protein